MTGKTPEHVLRRIGKLKRLLAEDEAREAREAKEARKAAKRRRKDVEEDSDDSESEESEDDDDDDGDESSSEGDADTSSGDDDSSDDDYQSPPPTPKRWKKGVTIAQRKAMKPKPGEFDMSTKAFFKLPGMEGRLCELWERAPCLYLTKYQGHRHKNKRQTKMRKIAGDLQCPGIVLRLFFLLPPREL